MILIREFEKLVSEAKLKNEILGQVHSCIGQEGVVVGTCLALTKEDYIISNHRSHGHVIAKGADLNSIMAEIYGKSTGTNGGRGGSMHIFEKDVGSICTTAIVGSGLPIGLGSSFASNFLNDGKITTVFFGDGATNEGTFGESLNIASILKLPIIFLLENNGLAITTKTENSSLITDFYQRAASYGIKSFQVDGQDVEEVYTKVKKAVKYIKKSNSPVFIEAKTIRFSEHAEGVHYANISKSGYRSLTELERLKLEKDPIKNYLSSLIEDSIINYDGYKQIIRKEKNKLKIALKFALESPLPNEDEAYTNVYINSNNN